MMDDKVGKNEPLCDYPCNCPQYKREGGPFKECCGRSLLQFSRAEDADVNKLRSNVTIDHTSNDNLFNR
jgi:hypothetical protein